MSKVVNSSAKEHGILGLEIPANRKRSAVPRHKEIDTYLARKICRDLGIAETTAK